MYYFWKGVSRQTVRSIVKKIYILHFAKELVEAINHENFELRTVKFFGPDSDKAIHTDPSLLTHILRNLILNALKYSEGAIDPEVHLVYRGAYFEISVKDYGWEYQKKIGNTSLARSTGQKKCRKHQRYRTGIEHR